MSAADVVQLYQTAPWAAVGLLSLLASAWVYKQCRKQLARVELAQATSATRQGERLGALERQVGLLDLRRRQVEAALLDEGVELPYWPADGPQQPRPRPRGDWHVDVPPRADDVDQADELGPETLQRRVPVPPLDPAVATRHRR